LMVFVQNADFLVVTADTAHCAAAVDG